MFGHVFKGRLKCILRNKKELFWTLCFPIILATLFNLALSNVHKTELFHAIPIAVVDNQTFREEKDFKAVLDTIEAQQAPLFSTSYVKEEEAISLLDKGEIQGYIKVTNRPELIVKMSGINQTIIKIFLEEYEQNKLIVATVLRENPNALKEGLITALTEKGTYIKDNPISKNNPNTLLNYFYALIGMACIYGGFLGLNEIMAIQGNLSKVAARLNLAPIHKLKTLAPGLLAAYGVQVIANFILLIYLVTVIKLDFGKQLLPVVLTCLLSSAMGITLGAFIGALNRKSEGVKIGILLGITMLGSFLAGMMQADISYMVNKAIPILAYINPVALISNSFYALYYYDGYSRYITNMILIGIFTVVFAIGTYIIIRRQRYASL